MSEIDATPGAAPLGAYAAKRSSVGTKAWVALATLWFIYVLNFLDRQLLSILA